MPWGLFSSSFFQRYNKWFLGIYFSLDARTFASFCRPVNTANDRYFEIRANHLTNHVNLPVIWSSRISVYLSFEVLFLYLLPWCHRKKTLWNCKSSVMFYQHLLKHTGWRNLVCQNSSYMIFLGRHIKSENSRVFSLKGGFYWLFREKKIIQIGPREAAGEFANCPLVVSC